MTIGKRAVREIIRHAGSPKPKDIRMELGKLDIPYASYKDWKLEAANPGGYYLAKMALAGYDIYWILTGEKQNGCDV